MPDLPNAIVTLVLALGQAPASGGEKLAADSALAQLGYYAYWQTSAQTGAPVEGLERVDENLYLLTQDCCVIAIHADAGTVRWSARAGGPGERLFTPAHVRSFWGRDLTLLTSSAGLQWRDRATGELVAKIAPGFIPSAGAVSDGLRVYVPGLDEMFYCLELVPTTGDVAVTQRWRVQTGGLTQSPAVLWNERLFFVADDGLVRACTARDKGRLWVFSAGSAVRAQPHVDGTGVYFGGTDRRVYKLDVHTGRYAWGFTRALLPGKISRPPVLIGERLYQAGDEGGVYVIDTNSGDRLWAQEEATGFISATPRRVHLLSAQGDVLAVDPADGRIMQRAAAPRVRFAVPNAASTAMYLADQTGSVLCAQEQHVPYLRFDTVQAAARAQVSAGP